MKYLYSLRKGSKVVRRFFSHSDYDSLEYFLSFFSLNEDELKHSYLCEDPASYSVFRDGFFCFGSEFVPVSCHLFDVSAVFDFCNQRNFDGRYSVLDVLSSWDCINLWVDRWNSVVNIACDFERDLAPSPDSPSAIGSESSSRPDQPYYGDSEANATKSASSDAGVPPACEEAQPPAAESEDNNV